MSVVLVHGALHGAWCWDGVVTELRDRRVDATIVELPLTSHVDDVAAARRAIDLSFGDVVVCGHSYGGCVISAAAAGVAAVRHLVYLCAFMVDAGEDPVGMMFADGTSPMLAALQVDDTGMFTVDPATWHEVFYNDSDPAFAEAMSARQRPMPFGDSWVTAEPPAWRTVPSTYITCSRDNAIPLRLQQGMAAHATEVIGWDSDHSPWATRPGDIADVLAALAGD